MSRKNAYLYVFDTLADWEIGFLTAELQSGRYFKDRTRKIEVKTFATTRERVVTMGGLTLVPDMTIDEVDPTEAVVLLLPGGDSWSNSAHEGAIGLTRRFLEVGIPVAAICGATLGLARAGLLNERKHTSNALDFLKALAPEYRGESLYRNEPAVVDRGLITASGVAPLEFARLVIEQLELFSPGTLDGWTGLYRDHEPRYYFQLVDSLPIGGDDEGSI